MYTHSEKLSHTGAEHSLKRASPSIQDSFFSPYTYSVDTKHRNVYKNYPLNEDTPLIMTLSIDSATVV